MPITGGISDIYPMDDVLLVLDEASNSIFVL